MGTEEVTVQEEPPARHTPGPWFMLSGPGTSYIVSRSVLANWGAPENFVGEIRRATLADAQLMRTAAELLKALENMMAAARCHYDPILALNEYGAQADAAIAKAKGG